METGQWMGWTRETWAGHTGPVPPRPGFCIKTHSAEGKVFINICHSPSIPAPVDMTEDELLQILEEDQAGFRIPMSLGEPHAELDASQCHTSPLLQARAPASSLPSRLSCRHLSRASSSLPARFRSLVSLALPGAHLWHLLPTVDTSLLLSPQKARAAPPTT